MSAALETLMMTVVSSAPGRALFLGAEPHAVLRTWPELTGWQPLKPLAEAWERAGFSRVDHVPPEKWPLVLILPGKSRDETLAWFAMARNHLQPGGRIIAAMPNSSGSGRFEKELKRATGSVSSIQKHKCRAFQAVEDGRWNEAIFSGWRELGKPREIPGTGFITQAGVFSSEHIDPGSQLLAEHLPSCLHGHLADLGAGWGYLSDTALKRCPGIERIDLFEADARALACARLNLARHLPPANPLNSPACLATDEPRVLFHWHDVTAGLPETYDAILMNPPFHTGQDTDVDLGRAFLTTAAASLKHHGKLHLVANRQLPYEPLLDSLRLAWRKVAEDKTYKVISAERR